MDDADHLLDTLYRERIAELIDERDRLRAELEDAHVQVDVEIGEAERIELELAEMTEERDRLRERLEAERRHRIAAVDREVETVDERDRLREANNKRAGILLHVMSVLGDAPIRTEEGLPDAVADLLDERDQLRTVVEDSHDWALVMTKIMMIIDGGHRIWGDPLGQQIIEAVRELEDERDRLRDVVTGSLLAIETVLMDDQVDMKVSVVDVLGRTSATLKRALGGQLEGRDVMGGKEPT